MRSISLDTETTGIDLWHGCKPFLATIYSPEESPDPFYWYWDVNPLTRQPEVPPEDLADIAERIESADEVILQNAKYDILAFGRIGLEWKDAWYKKVHDTLYAAHLLASGEPHDLTTLALQYTRLDIKPIEDRLERICKYCRELVRNKEHAEVFAGWQIAKEIKKQGPGDAFLPSAKTGGKGEKDKLWKWDMWLPRAIAKHAPHLLVEYSPEECESACPDYATTDSSVTLPVFQAQRELMKQRGLYDIYLGRTQKLIRCIVKMERTGVTYSEKRLDELHERFSREVVEDEQECIKLTKGKVTKLPKAGTTKEIKSLVFDDWKLQPKEYSDVTGEPSVDKGTLEAWLEELDKDTTPYKFIEKLAQSRKKNTALSYMDSYRRYATTHLRLAREFKLLHPSLNSTGSGTLRFTSQYPNEQNISKQGYANLRYIFGPEPGREWWSMDASNIELRIPAYEAGEVELIALFERPNDPPYFGSLHALNFSVVYPDVWGAMMDEVGPNRCGLTCKERYKDTYYQWCKNGGFAVQYGAVEVEGREGTADKAFHKQGAHRLLKDRFRNLAGLNDYWVGFANKHGYVETMPDKSICPERGYPLQCDRGYGGRGVKPTVPLNYHVQGTAMWWMCKAMIRVQDLFDRWYAKNRFDARIIMQVHDELVFDLPAGKGDKPWETNLPRAKEIARTMELGGEDIGVPVPTKIEYHPNNWAQGEYMKL